VRLLLAILSGLLAILSGLLAILSGLLAILSGLLAMFGQGDRETIEGAGCSGEVKAFDE